MKSEGTQFQTMILGADQPTSVPMEVIEVDFSTDNLLGNYAKAFVSETRRVEPLRAEQVNLTSEEVESYANYLLVKRIQTIDGTCSDFHRLKVLYIPAFIQYNISMIGRVQMRDRGITLHPVCDREAISYDQALLISEKIGMFQDVLQIVRDAMPRSTEGDKDVMSTAMVAGYVRSMHKVEHVASTYVTAFMGMKLREEAAMQVLYRIQYDDVAFIASALTTQRGLF